MSDNITDLDFWDFTPEQRAVLQEAFDERKSTGCERILDRTWTLRPEPVRTALRNG